MTGIVDKRLREGLMAKLKESGYEIYGEQLNILFYLFATDGVTQKRLSELTCKSKISIVKVVNSLELKNIVVRIQSNKDHRNNRIYLTAKGKKLKLPLLNIVDEHTAQVFKNFSDDEIDNYMFLLQKMSKNMDIPKI